MILGVQKATRMDACVRMTSHRCDTDIHQYSRQGSMYTAWSSADVMPTMLRVDIPELRYSSTQAACSHHMPVMVVEILEICPLSTRDLLPSKTKDRLSLENNFCRNCSPSANTEYNICPGRPFNLRLVLQFVTWTLPSSSPSPGPTCKR